MCVKGIFYFLIEGYGQIMEADDILTAYYVFALIYYFTGGLSAKIFSKMLVNGRVNIFMIALVKCKVTFNLVECWWLLTIQLDNHLSFHTSFIFYVTCSTVRCSDRHDRDYQPQMLLYPVMFSVKSHFLQPLMTTARVTF